MSERASQIAEEALRLSPAERVTVVERLLQSLDRPDPQVEALWRREAEERIDAFESGQLQAVPAEEVFAELEAHEQFGGLMILFKSPMETADGNSGH